MPGVHCVTPCCCILTERRIYLLCTMSHCSGFNREMYLSDVLGNTLSLYFNREVCPNVYHVTHCHCISTEKCVQLCTR